MRILLIIECAEPGGAENVFFSLVRGLKALGIEVRVLSLDTGWLTDKLESSGIDYVHIKSERKFDFILPLRIAKFIKQHEIELVHSHLLDAGFYAAIASRIASVPHICTDHGDVHLPQGKKFLRLKLKLMFLSGSFFIAVSSFTKDKLIELGIIKKRIYTLGNPIEPAQTCSTEKIKEIRESLGIDSDEHWLWFNAGMLRSVKNHACLIRGFAKAKELSSFPQTLLIAGEGSERSRLEALAHELGVSDDVRFLGLRNDVSNIMQAVNAFVLTSEREALPMVLLEAAVAGVLLISSDVGGVGDIISDKETGYLFKSGDSERLAKLMSAILDEPEKTKNIAENGKSHVLKKYSADFIYGQYKELYERLIVA